MTEREVMTWDDLGAGARALAEAVADDGYRPDIVLAIARGGLLVAGALGYALGVKNTFTMNVEFYTGIDERLDMPMILPPLPDLVDFEDTRVLIADDVADTGATLALVKGFCAGKVAEVRCAVLYEKPRSTVRCEYVWRRTDRWIDFPWSAEEAVLQPAAALSRDRPIRAV
jgi:hypoxanthine phosphoribosyltransferase